MGEKLSSPREALQNSNNLNPKEMNLGFPAFPSQDLMREYRHMGWERNAIIYAWTKCHGSQDFMLDKLFDIQETNEYSSLSLRTAHQIKAEIAKLGKRMPRNNGLRLDFQGDDVIPGFLRLRKLGLFSKKVFRNTKGLGLKYASRSTCLENKHIGILAKNINRGLRRLKHLTIKFDISGMGPLINTRPLLVSFKQTFVNLVSLKLSFKWYFELSERVLWSFDGLFKRVSPTLKHLDLDFNENGHEANLQDFPERLGVIIKNRLHKLESLCIDFTWTYFSTKIARLLINAACSHLRSLKSLSLNFEGCKVVQEEVNLSPQHTEKNNLGHLKLNFHYCSGLNMEYLKILQNDIVRECASLNELYLSILNCQEFRDDYYLGLEKKFREKLSLKKFKFLHSREG